MLLGSADLLRTLGCVDEVFVSSVMNGFDAERRAVRQAIESVGMHPLMAGTAAASPDASKHALLPLVEQAAVVVLVLGTRYGFIAEHGLSPTEDEFNHARNTGTPVLVFVQSGVEREEEQDAFVKRVQGGWGEGTFTGFFSDATELGFKVVQALTSHREAQRGSDAMPEAQQRARDLAITADRRGASSGNSVRVAIVPVGGARIIDAVVLDDGSLGDRAAAVVRQHGLVSQAAGITSQVNSEGVTLQAKAPGDWHTTTVALAADGAVVVDADARAEGSMGGMAISYPRVQAIIATAGTVAHALWELLPDGDSVRQVAVTACVPEADHHALVLSGQTGGSMGVPSIPSPLVAPDPALIVRRADVGTTSTNRVLAVSLKQAFADHGAVQD
jgi:hypothetical protein